jgi:uncharacterized protein (TIGR02466 family)
MKVIQTSREQDVLLLMQPMSTYQKITSTIGRRLNETIMQGFLNHYQREDIRKTHLFAGRYENIYLTEQHIQALGPLIAEAIHHAEDILQLEKLRAGFWFNFMPPGSTTTLHTHDDDDELLSGVYYVEVAENSGNLVLYDKSGRHAPRKHEITPVAGEFVFFGPDVPHEVTRNNSTQSRLSIGFNFGQVNK